MASVLDFPPEQMSPQHCPFPERSGIRMSQYLQEAWRPDKGGRVDRTSLGHETAGVERGRHRDWPECSEAGRTPLSSLRAGLLGHGCLDKHRVGPVSPEPAQSGARSFPQCAGRCASGHRGARDPLLKFRGALRPPRKTDTRWAGPDDSWGGGLTEAPSRSRAWPGGWAPACPPPWRGEEAPAKV